MKLVFWLEELSLHFSSTIRAVAQLGHDVTVVAREELQAQRRALGWSVPDFGTDSIIIAPTLDSIRGIVDKAGQDTIHVVVGMRGAFFGTVIRECGRRKVRLGVYGEAPHPDGWKVIAKWVAYTGYQVAFGRHIDFFLALGSTGVNWYKSCGFTERKVFNCAYATELPALEATSTGAVHEADPFRIVFVGRCLPIKRLDLALHALRRHSAKNWSLTVIGDGPMRATWEKMAREWGLSEKVQFAGSQPYRQTVATISCSDLLLLPSTHEGWGAVANEALMTGVPVLCSDRCGAADLVVEDWRGGTFLAGDHSSLERALINHLSLGRPSPSGRERIRQWSSRIRGEAVGQYILDVLEHVYSQANRPTPPWQTSEVRIQ